MANSSPTDVVRACVVSGGITTPYRVAGRGGPTVVLSTDQQVVDALLLTSGPDRRVVVPDLRHGMSTWTTPMPHSRAWLVAFLEALGLESVRLMVDAAYAADAHGVAMIYPELVASVELIAPRAAGSLDASR